ncbi:MAG: hypothetical protein PVF13_07655, partial [Chromatiales bacterium]
ANDLNRFRELKRLAHINDPLQEANQSYTDALKNVYSCGNDRICEQPWQRARAYLKQHSTTPVKMDGENILMTGEPVESDDISITVSRILDPKTNQMLIFMDLQCKENSQGSSLCNRGEKVQRIKENFQAALSGESALPGNPADVGIASPNR